MDLEVREAVDDVDAGPLHRPRPLDVPVLVEARLQLHEAHTLAAVLGNLDERGHDRGVVARAVDRGLQCDHGRIARRLAHEAFERGHEGVVRMVDEHVAAPDLREEALASAHCGESGGRARHPGLVLEVGPVERGELREVGEVERPPDGIDLLLARPQALGQAPQHPVRDRARDLEPDDIAEAAAAQLELDGLEQVVGLVRNLEVGVAGDAEDGALDDLHLREEPVEEVGDDALEGDEGAALADLEEAREAFRHLHAREALLPGLRVADEHGEAVREARDVREGLPGPTARGVSTG